MQFVHHGFWIRPVFFIEFPVALYGPVEEIDDNLIDFDAFLLVAACHFKHFLLRTVAQLALPQAHTVLREFRRAAGHCGVIFQDLFRCIGCGQPVVHIFGRACSPFGVVLSEGYLSDSRIVPPHTIS